MEVKQFTQGQFADTFEGSALDLLKQVATATPATATNSATAVAVPATTDPLKPETTLNPEQDAAKFLQQQQVTAITTDEEEDTEEAAATAAVEAAKIAAEKTKKAGRPPVEKLDDNTVKLVKSLIDDKKLFGFQDGKIETKADLQDLLDANFNHKIETQQKEIYEQVFKSFTPAMQFIAQYAQQVSSPSELLPLLQNTSNIERFASLDENNPIHQEQIVREKMRLAGDSEDVIEQEITDLKDRAKLADKAKVYKPALQQFYEKQVKQLADQKAQEEHQYFEMVKQNDANIRKVLDADQFDGMKLKQTHKGVVYELLAVPREEYGGGMGIYHIIDTLFQQGKFDKLAKIALLAGDEKAFEELISNKAKFTMADSTARKLNTSIRTAGPTSTDVDPDEEQQNTKTLVRPTRTGFGFSSR